MKSFFEEFKKFALRGNAVDLAVGIVIGAAFTAVSNSLVNDILTPPIGLLLGGLNFKDLIIPLGGQAVIHYGLFLQTIANFVLTALALFVLVRFLNRLVRNAKQDEEDGVQAPETKSAELTVLEQIRDTLLMQEERDR
jgi:large conductance mechanosensitive channel